jgi:hypothetical protein
VARPAQYTFVRAGTYAPPLAFLLLSLLCVIGADYVGGRIFYAVMSLLTGFWLARSLRVRVETSHEGLMIRTSYKTTRLQWDEVRGAELRPMRTFSPFKFVRTYSALAVGLKSGRVLQFDDIARSKAMQSRVVSIVDHINTWCDATPS